MDKLRAISLFVRLAELGSFTKVADEFDSSKSMVSKEITRLESSLGVRLVHRTTRNIQLTHAGQGYLQRAKDILDKLDDADSFVQDLHQAPRGTLKINAPMVLGVTDLAPMFAEFMRQYPDITLDIHLGDEDVDLVEQGFDLGFRAASRPFDSTYVGRPLTKFNYHICASQSYVNTHQPIKAAADLKDHNCFEYHYFKGKNIWPIDDGVAISGTLKANNVILMLEAIKAGHGIGMLPEFACRSSLASGEIVNLLPEAKKPQLTLYALYPVRQFVPAKVLQCIDFIENWFSKGHHSANKTKLI